MILDKTFCNLLNIDFTIFDVQKWAILCKNVTFANHSNKSIFRRNLLIVR